MLLLLINDKFKMKLNWIDILPIAQMLYDKHQDVDPRYIRFTDLHSWILQLDDFEGKPDGSNEKILEAIQAAWLEEADL